MDLTEIIPMKVKDIEREVLIGMLFGRVKWEIDQKLCEHDWSDTYKEWVGDSTVYKKCKTCHLRVIVSTAFD